MNIYNNYSYYYYLQQNVETKRRYKTKVKFTKIMKCCIMIWYYKIYLPPNLVGHDFLVHPSFLRHPKTSQPFHYIFIPNVSCKKLIRSLHFHSTQGKPPSLLHPTVPLNKPISSLYPTMPHKSISLLYPTMPNNKLTSSLYPKMPHDKPTKSLYPTMPHNKPTKSFYPTMPHNKPTKSLCPTVYYKRPNSLIYPTVSHTKSAILLYVPHNKPTILLQI